MLGTEQLQAISTLVQNDNNFGVHSFLIDARESKIDVYIMFVVRWAEGGVRCKLLHSGSLSQNLITRFEAENAPVIVFAHKGQKLDNISNLVTNKEIQHEYVVMCEDNTIEYFTNNAFKVLTNRHFIDHSNTTTIKLYGRDNLVLEDRNLPCIVDLELFKNSKNNIVGIEIVSSYSSQVLHDKKWYRVECDDAKCKMIVDMQVDVPAADSLLITSDNLSFSVLSAPKPRVTGSIPDKLVVIFDRTCPDQDSWLNAYSLSVENKAEIDWDGSGESDMHKDIDEKVPLDFKAPKYFGAYNETIRNQLGIAINSLMEANPNTQLDLWWFADTTSPGLIKGNIELSKKSHGKIVSCSNQIDDTIFNTCQYSPGIDLWDPIGETLKKALEGNLNNSAVIIVGNSPPFVPSEVDSPIRELLNASGFPVTYRRETCTLWHSALNEADNNDIPIYYLFLTHQLSEIVQSRSSGYLRYRDLASKVSASLAKCKLHLIEKPATTKGIEEGILKISNIIESRSDPISKVVINCE